MRLLPILMIALAPLQAEAGALWDTTTNDKPDGLVFLERDRRIYAWFCAKTSVEKLKRGELEGCEQLLPRGVGFSDLRTHASLIRSHRVEQVEIIESDLEDNVYEDEDKTFWQKKKDEELKSIRLISAISIFGEYKRFAQTDYSYPSEDHRKVYELPAELRVLAKAMSATP